MRRLTSKDNPLVKTLRRLLGDPSAHRRMGQVVLEGEHLIDAWRKAGPSGQRPGNGLRHWVCSETHWAKLTLAAGQHMPDDEQLVVLPDALIADLSSLETPAHCLAVVDLPVRPGIDDLRLKPTVVLDRVQDPGNVGSILRSAAGLGVQQVLALAGTASLWSPKVLRAGQGAHFSLTLFEGESAAALQALRRLDLPVVATSSHARQALHHAQLPKPAAWVFGHEGQGVAPEWLAQALTVRIPQQSQESLNVAAAAAICLYHHMVISA